MSLLLGVVADDYTGASDLANALTRNHLSTIQTIDVPDAGLQLPDVDAIVVALKSRSVAPDLAVKKSVAAASWMKSLGAEHILFKICSTFDSTDEGNIGPVADALAALVTCIASGLGFACGAYGTHFWVDRKEQLVGLLMVQESNGQLMRDFENAVMQAIVE